MQEPRAAELVEDLFRRESGRLVSALARFLGPSSLALAEDVVQDALLSATQAWRFGVPKDPTAWILQVAKRRAIDLIRRNRRFAELRPGLGDQWSLERTVDLALSPRADAENQIAMMFAICDESLSSETHVTLILRFLCGFSPAEIARAFLVDVATIDRRLHRGRRSLERLEDLRVPSAAPDVAARQPSIERALYLLFNEGHHGSDPDHPIHPAMYADAIRLAEILLESPHVEASPVHALAALFCFGAARLSTRLDAEGVFVPLADQDRTRWDPSLLVRGAEHLEASARGDTWARWHIEAGIALEHVTATSVKTTNWRKIVDYYDALARFAPSPVVALNRGLAIAELHGIDAGREALEALATDPKMAGYSFYWAGRADLERRAARDAEARVFYRRAIELATSSAERRAYERRLIQAVRLDPPT